MIFFCKFAQLVKSTGCKTSKYKFVEVMSDFVRYILYFAVNLKDDSRKNNRT